MSIVAIVQRGGMSARRPFADVASRGGDRTMFAWLNFKRPAVTPRPFPIADERYERALHAGRATVDQRLFRLLIAQWALVMVATMASSIGIDFSTTGRVWTMLVLNGVLTGGSLWLLLHSPVTPAARMAVAVGQGLYSTLLFQATFGRLETHLHLFAWLVVLAAYLEVRVLLAAGLAAVASQLIAVLLNASTMPVGNDFGHLGEHAAWLVLETLCLSIFISSQLKSLFELTRREAALEALNENLERKVERRTRDVTEKLDAINREYSVIREVHAQAEADELSAIRQLPKLQREVSVLATTLMDTTWRWSDSRLPEALRPHWRTIREASQKLLNLVQDKHPVEDSLVGVRPGSLIGASSAPKECGPQTMIDQYKADASTAIGQDAALLLVDDPIHQALTTYALNLLGYRVEVAHTGPRTYYSAMLREYTLILVDVELANEEGFDTIEALQLLPKDVRKSARVFALTSVRTSEIVLRGTELGIDGFVMKPVDVDALRATLEGNSHIAAPRPARRASDRATVNV